MRQITLPRAGTPRYFRLRRSVRIAFWTPLLVLETVWLAHVYCGLL